MKEIILKEISKILNSDYVIPNLNYDSIEENIDQIVDYITDDRKLRRVIKKDKEIWLIKRRLGLYVAGETNLPPLDFEELCIKLYKRIKSVFFINPLTMHELIWEIRKRFCSYIKRINNEIIIEAKRNNEELYILENKLLRNANMELEERNKELTEVLNIMEKQSMDMFVENVMVKVKKYLK